LRKGRRVPFHAVSSMLRPLTVAAPSEKSPKIPKKQKKVLTFTLSQGKMDVVCFG